MEKDKEQIIEAYFAGTLSADQQQQLEQLIKHDTEFLEMFTFEKETRDTIIYNERSKIKERFRVLEQQTKPVRKLTPWYYVAASILILCVAGWLFFKNQAPVGPEELYAQYMEPYPNVVTPLVRGEFTVDKKTAEAFELYDNEAYNEAAALLEELHNANPNEQITFYLAICHLMLNNHKEAISLLETREWQNTSMPSSTVVNWYLGLAFLKKNDREQALSHFKLVAASSDSLSDSATKLVEEMDNAQDLE